MDAATRQLPGAAVIYFTITFAARECNNFRYRDTVSQLYRNLAFNAVAGGMKIIG